jgi:DNA-binding GntR family transcriptional regulator
VADATKRFKRTGHGSLRSQAVVALRGAILSGQFKPGAVLNEKELAERLGVSKTPIREGLSLLEHEGLIQTIPRRGYMTTVRTSWTAFTVTTSWTRSSLTRCDPAMS